eukprot:132166_1
MLNIKATDEGLQAFNDLKLGKKTAFVIFKVGKKDIELESVTMKADVSKQYLGDAIAAIKKTGAPRFAVIDWNHKMCFIKWVPDTAKAQAKMKAASVAEQFKQELVGVQVTIQATDDSELSAEKIEEETKSNV